MVSLTLRPSLMSLPGPLLSQPQLLSDLSGVHGARHVLLVSEHQQIGVPHTIISQHLLQLLPSLLHPETVRTVHHIDDRISVLVVMLPEGSDLGLASNVPDSETDVFVLHGLNSKNNFVLQIKFKSKF